MAGEGEAFREIAGGGFWIALGAFTTAVFGAAFWLVAGRLVGPEGVGYATTVFSAASFLAVLSGLGLPVAVLREAPLHGSSALVSALTVGLASSLLAGYAGAHLFSGLFGGGLARYAALIAVLTLLMVEGQISLMGLVAARAEHLYFASMLAAQVVKVSLGLGLVLAGLGVWGLIMGIAASVLVQLAAALLLSLARMGAGAPRLAAGVLRVGLANYPLIVSTGLVSSVSVLLAAVSTGSPGYTGLFYISLMVALALGFIPMGVASAALPRMVERGDTGVIGGPARLALGLVAPLAAGVFAASSGILGLVSPAYVEGGGLLAVLALSIVPVSALQLSISRLNAEGAFRRVLAAGLARLLLLVLLVALLVPRLGLEGLGWAYTVSTGAGLLAALDVYMLRLALTSLLVQGVGIVGGLAAGRLLGFWPLSMTVAAALGYLAGHVLGLARLGEVSSALRVVVQASGLRRLRGLLPSLETIARGFVLAFTVTLVLAAVMLAVGDEDSANTLTEYAYYMLVAGVAAALVDVARGGGGEE